MRDAEQARLTDAAYEEAVRLLTKHRSALDRVTETLIEKETIDREELNALLSDLAPESRSSETVGTVRLLDADAV
jgi:cell division protease FtsH